MKSIKVKFNLYKIIARILSVLKMHFSAILFLVFLLSVVVWALIFWYYGIGISRSQSEVEVKIIKIKESDLRKILDDVQARSAAQEIILDKSIPNPFIKSAEGQGSL